MILFYKSVDTPPHFIWIFNENIIEQKHEFIQEDSQSGDKCHFNLIGLTAKQSKRIFNDFNLMVDCKVCENNPLCQHPLPRNILPEDIRILELFGRTSPNVIQSSNPPEIG